MFILCKLCQQLKLSHLVFVYEKEVAFVPRSGKIVGKINRVTSSYETDTLTAKSNVSQKKNQNWRKVLTKFIVSNIIDGINIELIESDQLKVKQWVYTARWSHKFYWRSKNYFLGKCNKRIRAARTFNKGTTRKTEKKKRSRAFSQLGPVSKYFADCANLSILVIYADSLLQGIRLNSRNRMKLFFIWLASHFTSASLCCYNEGKIVTFNFRWNHSKSWPIMESFEWSYFELTFTDGIFSFVCELTSLNE